MRIGPETVTDPAFLVTRNMEDFVTWVDTSKIKRKVQKFNEVRTSSLRCPAPVMQVLLLLIKSRCKNRLRSRCKFRGPNLGCSQNVIRASVQALDDYDLLQ